MIRPYQSGDEDKINSLFTEVFQKERSVKHWNWKYKDNLIEKTIVTVDQEDEDIAGHVALVPFPAKWHDREVVFGARTDTMVSPRYRGKGIYKHLNEEMIETARVNGIDYLFGYPAAKAKVLLEKYTGAVEIGYIPRLMKINKVSSLLSSRIPVLKGVKPLLKAADLFFRSKEYELPSGYEIRSLNRADDSFNLLWEKGKSLANITLVRNADFLNWRFINHPDFKYHLIGLYKEEELVGYAVTRIEEKPYGAGIVRNGFIVDLFADSNEESWKFLIQAAIQQLSEADIIQTWALEHTVSYKLLKALFKFKHKDAPMPLVGNKINDELNEPVTLSDWYVTPADVDSF